MLSTSLCSQEQLVADAIQLPLSLSCLPFWATISSEQWSMCYIESSVNCMTQLHWGRKVVIKACTSGRELGYGPISLEMTCIPHMPLSAKDALPQFVCSYSDVILRVHTMQDLCSTATCIPCHIKFPPIPKGRPPGTKTVTKMAPPGNNSVGELSQFNSPATQILPI